MHWVLYYDKHPNLSPHLILHCTNLHHSQVASLSFHFLAFEISKYLHPNSILSKSLLGCNYSTPLPCLELLYNPCRFGIAGCKISCACIFPGFYHTFLIFSILLWLRFYLIIYVRCAVRQWSPTIVMPCLTLGWQQCVCGGVWGCEGFMMVDSDWFANRFWTSYPFTALYSTGTIYCRDRNKTVSVDLQLDCPFWSMKIECIFWWSMQSIFSLESEVRYCSILNLHSNILGSINDRSMRLTTATLQVVSRVANSRYWTSWNTWTYTVVLYQPTINSQWNKYKYARANFRVLHELGRTWDGCLQYLRWFDVETSTQ